MRGTASLNRPPPTAALTDGQILAVIAATDLLEIDLASRDIPF